MKASIQFESPAQPALTSRHGTPVLLRGVRVRGDLRGALFESQVEQRYANDTPRAVEVVYTFPKQADTVLLGVNVRIGDRQLTGQVQVRDEAEQGYDMALVEGQSAILLELNASGSYTLNLGNLAPGETCVITLHQMRTLPLQHGSLRLIVPTVISSRYGNPVRDAGLSPQQVPVTSMTVEHPFELSVQLHGSLARTAIASPSHPISVDARASDEQGRPVTRVKLAVTGRLDRDFVLVLDGVDVASMMVAGPELDAGSGQVAALLSLQAGSEGPEGQAPIAVKVMVDCSGSMNGSSMSAAIRSLRQLVEGLRASDRLSLTRFGSRFEHRCRTLWPVTPASRQVALDWVDQLRADLGGTEMVPALQSVLALAPGEPSDVLMITDGQVWKIEEVSQIARAGGQRIFVVGIGADAREGELRSLAESTGGRCEFVLDGEDVSAAILRTFARLRAPHFAELELRWPDAIQPIWVSDLGPALFGGDTLHLLVTLPRALEAGQEVVLLGRRVGKGAGAESAEVEIGRLRAEGGVEPTDSLARMRVARQYEQWAAAAASLVAAPGQCRSLAPVPEALMDQVLAAQLVTAETSFLLVHERAKAFRNMPVQHIVEQMHTAGASGFGQPSAMSSAAISFDQGSSRDSLELCDFMLGFRRDESCDPIEMSPGRFQAQLNKESRYQWPRDWRGVCELGMPQAVADVLARALAGRTEDEATLILALLDILSDWVWLCGGVLSLKIETPLQQAVIAALQGIEEDRWPLQEVPV